MTARSAVARWSLTLLAACGGATGLPVGLGAGAPADDAGSDDAVLQDASVDPPDASPAPDAAGARDALSGTDATSGADGGHATDADTDEAGRDVASTGDGPVESAGPRSPWYCHDGVEDFDETDVDCGGSCPACWFGQHCAANADCSPTAPPCNVELGGCACDGISMTCVASVCVDNEKDGNETDIDCGGECPQCAVGQGCSVDYDCTTRACDGVTSICDTDPCSDHRQDGLESAVDCGGGRCAGCAVSEACQLYSDCATGFCDGLTGTCVTDGCTDHAVDGQETNVDCGGSVCAARCPGGDFCDTSADCMPGLACGGSPRERG